jgi:hypothetical protein
MKPKSQDIVLAKLLQLKLPVTQRNYIELAWFGDKHSLDELEGEERAELPESFDTWPADSRGLVN